MAIQIKAPNDITPGFGKISVFLAGSIEQGTAQYWQQKVVNQFKPFDNVIFLNPRRDNWDSSLDTTKSNPQFRQQVLWELDGQDECNFIFLYFDPETKSPISLLELGLYAASGKMIVVCPKGFWRKGNVDLVCERFNIPNFNFLDYGIDHLQQKIKNKFGNKSVL
jgi:hypothetical protein